MESIDYTDIIGNIIQDLDENDNNFNKTVVISNNIDTIKTTILKQKQLKDLKGTELTKELKRLISAAEIRQSKTQIIIKKFTTLIISILTVLIGAPIIAYGIETIYNNFVGFNKYFILYILFFVVLIISMVLLDHKNQKTFTYDYIIISLKELIDNESNTDNKS